MKKNKKVYVVCGELRGVIIADSPIHACTSLLKAFGKGKKLDPDYFYLDERGFREDKNATFTVPIEQVLRNV